MLLGSVCGCLTVWSLVLVNKAKDVAHFVNDDGDVEGVGCGWIVAEANV